ncbi:MAG: peptidylprolyl isomerase [Alphaproteobacteria bacterium]|nr:peptidylprolyl isomerase [Alphaproteobacteria bacterium]
MNCFSEAKKTRPIIGIVGIVSVLVPLLFLVQTGMAQASASNKIVRIVNDYPISEYDVDARLRMVIATAGRPTSESALQRIRSQVLEGLTDERIQLQEASRLGLTVDNEEIQSAIATIEKSNGMAQGALLKTLTARGIDAATLISQIRATLAWRKVVRQRLSGRVAISDEDIDAYLADLGQRQTEEFLLAEIFISAQTVQDLPAAKAVIEDIRDQIRKGNSFQTLARQFSQAPTAAGGGDMGWVDVDQLDPRLAAALRAMPVGQVSPPVEVDDGYYLLALRDRREFGKEGRQETLYNLQRYYAPFAQNASNAVKRQIVQRAERARAEISGCTDVAAVAKKYGAQSTDLGAIRLGELPGPLRPFIEKLGDSGKTKALTLIDGVLIMVLCNKEVKSIGLPDRDQVRATLLNRRSDLEARRYLRDLRQNALIEIPQ